LYAWFFCIRAYYYSMTLNKLKENAHMIKNDEIAEWTTVLIDEYAESTEKMVVLNEKLVALNEEMYAIPGEDFMNIMRNALRRCILEKADDTAFRNIGDGLKKAYAEKDETEIGRLIIRAVFLYQALLLLDD